MEEIIKSHVLGLMDAKKEYYETLDVIPSTLPSVIHSLHHINDNRADGDWIRIIDRIDAWFNDIHNLAVYYNIILDIVNKKYEMDKPAVGVLYLESLIEAFITTARSSYDLLVYPILYFVDEKYDSQVPKNESMNKVIKWINKDTSAGILSEEIRSVLINFTENFEMVKRFRDDIVHKGKGTLVTEKNSKYFVKLSCESFHKLFPSEIIQDEGIELFGLLREISLGCLELSNNLGLSAIRFLDKKGFNTGRFKVSAIKGDCLISFKELLLYQK